MRINVNENIILKAIGDCFPVKSSHSKLVKATGMARNEVGEVIDGLKKIGYLNATTANEIYLLEDGRKYLGVGTSKPESSKAILKKEKPVEAAPSTDSLALESIVTGKSESPTEQHSVLASIDELATKLNKPVVKIVDCDLKGQALAKLADLMSDDIAELLLDIKSDLERAAA